MTHRSSRWAEDWSREPRRRGSPDVGGFRWFCSCGSKGIAGAGYRSEAGTPESHETPAGCENLMRVETTGACMAIKLKQSQRVFIVQCGFIALGAAVAIGFFRALT
jgi:hypothetical protein